MRRYTLLAAVFVVALAAMAAAPGLAIAQSDTNATDDTGIEATLQVEQPEYVSGQVASRSGGYEANYQEVTIIPQNFDREDVLRYGVDTSAGRLTEDSTYGVYEFDSEGEEGTFELYWIVQEDVLSNGTETTEERRYETTIQISETTEYEHVPAGTLDEQEADAQNWSAFASGVREIGGDDADLVEYRELALSLLELQQNPLSALSGGFSSTLILMVSTWGGRLVLLMFAVIFVFSMRELMRYRNRTESTLADRGQLDEELTELELRKKKQVLENNDWQDIPGFDDTTARAFRESLGPNPLAGTKRLLSILRPKSLVRDRLLAMGHSGYVARIERDTARTDGGATATADPPIDSVELVAAESVAPDAETDDLSDPSDELVEAIDWNDDTLQHFDLPATTLDSDRMASDLSALDFEELMEEVNVSHMDFDDPGVYGQYIREFVDSVRQHDFTDDDGRVDETRYVMNQFLHLALVERDLFEVPILDFVGDAVERELIDHDPIEETKQYVDDVEAGKYS